MSKLLPLPDLSHIDIMALDRLLSISISFISGLGIFIFFWLASKSVGYVIKRATRHLSADKQQVMHLLSECARIAILFIGAVTALGSMGVNVNALIASLGLSSFALSFAMKDALSNILAGVMVLIYQPFKLNDVIKVGDYTGRVIKINLRYISLATDNQEILIPNSSILSQAVVVNH